VAQACRERGIKTVPVSAGYICDEPRREFFRHMEPAAGGMDWDRDRRDHPRERGAAHRNEMEEGVLLRLPYLFKSHC
jgi:hypothetical protein